MKRLSSYIPNVITCCNLLAGCLACIFALKSAFETASACIIIAAVCDFLDGLSARLLHAYSPMGKELDSLSDLVSFGLAPGLMIYTLLSDYLLLPYGNFSNLAYIALLIPVAGGLRLAKFNIDDPHSGQCALLDRRLLCRYAQLAPGHHFGADTSLLIPHGIESPHVLSESVELVVERQ